VESKQDFVHGGMFYYKDYVVTSFKKHESKVFFFLCLVRTVHGQFLCDVDHLFYMLLVVSSLLATQGQLSWLSATSKVAAPRYKRLGTISTHMCLLCHSVCGFPTHALPNLTKSDRQLTTRRESQQI
jgi:hypothetical protein